MDDRVEARLENIHKENCRFLSVKMTVKTVRGSKESKNNARVFEFIKKDTQSSNSVDRDLLALGISRNL